MPYAYLNTQAITCPLCQGEPPQPEHRNKWGVCKTCINMRQLLRTIVPDDPRYHELSPKRVWPSSGVSVGPVVGPPSFEYNGPGT